jgi:phosphopantothenoylcysteine decarboxylase/phosphopantothenate--cysteine ligase
VLKNRNILLGVTGSIAAYKSVDLARRLMDEGAVVNVVMTDAACRFITPYILEAITGKRAIHDLFKDPYSHLDLSKDAHLFIIAPATANTINKLSCGIADNLLSNLWLTYRGPVLMAPAMNSRMYQNPLVQKHIKSLKKTGVSFAGPVQGSLACGEEGIGRMAEVNEIVEAAITSLAEKDLSGRRILVTAGPTREPIDPVRYVSNRSSGKMGYAVAKAALRRGAEVTLISGPSALTPPNGANFISVERASEMELSVMKHLNKSDTVIMTAAVSDFSPASTPKVKLKKKSLTSLDITKNTDILKKISSKKGRRVLVGFAAETGNNVKNAREKLKDKKLDLIVLNDVTQKGAGFDVDTNIVTILDKKGKMTELPLMDKIDVADAVIDKIVQLKK